MSGPQMEYMKLKLEFLSQQQGKLVTATQGFVDKVMEEAKSWLDGSHRETSFEQILAYIDGSVVLLINKCVEVTGERTPGTTPAAATTATIPTAAAATTTTTMDGQHASPFQAFHSGLGHETAGVNLQKLTARMETIEEAVSSLRGQAETVKQFQQASDKSVEELTLKTEAVQKKVDNSSTKLSALQKETEDITAKHSTAQVKIDELSDKTSDLQKKLKSLNTKSTGLKKKVDDLSALEENVDSVSDKLCVLETTVKENVQQATDRQGEMEEKLKEMSKKYEAGEIAIQVLRETMIEELAQQTKSMETEKQSLQEMVTVRKGDLKRLELVEIKVRGLQKLLSKDVKKTEDKLQEVEKNYKAVCQMMAEKIDPLVELREIFDKKVEARDENVKLLNTVVADVKTLENRLSQLESTRRQPVGFSALYFTDLQTPSDTALTKYETLDFNTGDHFDVNTGQFQVPSEGLCLVVVRLCERGSGGVDVDVWCRPAAAADDNDDGNDDNDGGDDDNDDGGDDDDDNDVNDDNNDGIDDDQDNCDDLVCQTRTTEHNDVKYAVAVWPVKTGDILYVKTDDMSDGADIYNVMFSCCMLG